MNKKNIWFLTLFSLVLVLSVYYITMPDDVLIKTSIEPDMSITESLEPASMVAKRVSKEEKVLSEMEDLNTILTDVNKSSEEKNVAYEKMKTLNKIKGEEESLEQCIKKVYNLNSLVTLDGNDISVVLESSDKDINLANNVMRTIQENYENKMYISIKFE